MPLSPNVETMINQAGSVVVEHVAKKNALDLTDDAALRDWTKRFADLVARYRSVVRLCTKNDKSYVESAAIKDAVTSADQFLMQHTHWTWDEQWVTARWIAAALERKRIWEAEQERIRLLKEKEEQKLLAEAQALLNSNTFEYLTEEEWETLRNDPPIEETSAPTVFNLFDPTFDPIHSSEEPGSPLSDLTSSVSSPATCVDPLSPSLSASPLPIQKDDDVKVTKQSAPVSVIISKPPPVALKPTQPTRGGPAGRTGQRGRGGSATATATHVVNTPSAPAVQGTTTITETAVKPHTGPPKPLNQRLPEVPSSDGHKATENTLTSTTTPTPPIIARKPPVKAKPINPTTARDTPIFIPKSRPGPRTSQLRLPTASIPSPAVLPKATTLPKLDTSPSRAGSKRKTRDEGEDFVDEDSEEEDENSLYLMGCGGILIGTGHLNSPSCDSCASTNSKCFKLYGRSCCARCHQEHVKCPLDKPTTTPRLDKHVAPPEKPSLPKSISKRQKTDHVLAG